MASDELWCAGPPGAFESHAFGNDLAVFVVRTADTHVLGPGASLVLKAMMAAPGAALAADAWLGLALPELESPPDAAERSAFLALLDELEGIGLVMKRPAPTTPALAP